MIAVLFPAFFSPAFSQKTSNKKYPSLFWEITGNGLKKPSYLFGTMHVSSKMVFHLSDSFYLAIKNVDAVALELNSDVWQGQMVRLERLQQNYRNFSQPAKSDYLNEKSFQVTSYVDELKASLSTEPAVVNSLLYRSYKSKEDFEEDTFLDLYIFQTGKKLGKRATGVENYYETEQIILEAYNDMGKEKKKRSIDTDGESMFEIEQKSQDAYRRGDLDLLDSLDRMMERSDAFREKFLYKRNEIQANSIDTILKKSSLFVGVGAAHLAGERGVIDLLRKKGYKLRPVFMANRDATQKETIDKMKVPVTFTQTSSADQFIKVDMPGPLYKMGNDFATFDRLQYSDMSNGSYYLVTRVNTHAAFTGTTADKILKKVDSLLYENIPGKIQKKNSIIKNGYNGYDITNLTRRGDLQRYQLFVTPFEVIIFKMSGKENYINGPEAHRFFNSIQLKQINASWSAFKPAQGGFKINFPGTPLEKSFSGADDIDRWEYEAIDRATGNAYLVFKKSVQNFLFLEEDRFDLGLMDESFRMSEIFDKQLYRHLTNFKGYPAMDVSNRMKDGSFVKARFIIKGPHYFLVAARAKNASTSFEDYFSSFEFTPYNYASAQNFNDTFLHYKVTTPVVPELEQNLRSIVEKFSDENEFPGAAHSYWPKTRNALFRSDSTGEMINVSMQQYPKYFHVKDSSAFWEEEVEDFTRGNDLVIAKRDSFSLSGGVQGYRLELSDTNSSRLIKWMFLLRNDRIFRIVSLGDTLTRESDFVQNFYASFLPEGLPEKKHIFNNKLDLFISDLSSKDSITKSLAEDAISNLYYGGKGIPTLIKLINQVQFGEAKYFDNKSKLIAELGYIREPGVTSTIVKTLKDIYEKTSDTSTFQNEVFRALAKHRSKEAYDLLKDLILQDPPVFESSYELSGFFRDLEDSISLTKTLFPELLRLSTIDDYKEGINSLLLMLVDSGLLKSKHYKTFFSKIYFDAKIALKKQSGKDEKILEREIDNDDDERTYSDNSSNRTNLDDYTVLLMPFYDKNPGVLKFYNKLLASRDPLVQLKTVKVLLRFKKSVPDSLLIKLASSDKYRGRLYELMEKYKQLDKFPAKYKNQLDIARSNLVLDKNYDRIDSIVYAGKQQVSLRDKKGLVYFFKYRVKKEDDWKIGLSGLQPEDQKMISSDDRLVKMTEKKFHEDEPLEEQFN
ncbi:MAG: TraB/GumN family protein, partial [Chitinophagaceae bacterium]